MMRFLDSVARSNLGPLERPYKLNYCITYRCQSRCLTCNIWKMKPEGELSLEEIERFARANPYLSWVQLTGGEPFLRKDIAEVAETFARYCKPYILSIPTNSLCNPSYIETKVKRILETDIPRFALTLSLDGPLDAHDRIRGVPGNFLNVMELYGRLKPLTKQRKGFMLVLGYTLSKFNEGQLSETLRAVKIFHPEITADDFHLNVAQTSPNYYTNQGDSVAPDPFKAASEIREHMMKKKGFGTWPYVENRYLRGLVSFLDTGKSPMKSREGDVSCFMDSFGNVYPSIMSDVKLGNVRENYSLANILKGDPPEPFPHWTSCEAYQTVLGHLL